MTLFKSLGTRSFALLWSGQTISRLGDSLNSIALAWWVLEKTGSAAAMGTVLIFRSVPLLLFVLIGGVAVDRLPRPRVMLVSDLARGFLTLGIAFLAVANLLQVWHLYIWGLAFGFVDAFFQPAYTAIVPEITPRESLPSANSLTALGNQVSGIFGPALGAAIVALGGTPTAFAVDGLSFLVSAACLLPLQRLPQHFDSNSSATGLWHDLRAGFKMVFSSVWLWFTIALAALANFTVNGPFSVSMPFLVKNSLHADVGALGVILSMVSVGSIAGSLWLGRQTRIRRRGLIAYVAWTLGGLLVAVFGLPVSLLTMALVGAAFGFSFSLLNLIWANTLQELVPGPMLGRVSSIDWLGSFALQPLGYGAAGWATDRFGPSPVFLFGGLATAALGLVGLATPGIRQLD